MTTILVSPRRIQAGELSPAERMVLEAAADGLTVPRTAERLGRSVATVRNQRCAAMQVLGARDTTHAVAIAIRRGLIS